MKRINLSVNLEDSETLAAEVRELVNAQSKQIAREVINEVLMEDIERIADNRVKQLKESSYWNPTVRNIVDAVSKRMDDEMKKNETVAPLIDDMLNRKLETILDARIAQAGNLDTFIQNYIDKSIASALINRANGNQEG